VGEHRVAHLHIERDNHSTGPDRPQARRDPLRTVAGLQRHVVATPDAPLGQAAGQPPRVVGQLGVGPLLDLLLVQRQHSRPAAALGERLYKGLQCARLAHCPLLLIVRSYCKASPVTTYQNPSRHDPM
jgi:hypothetical protein